MHTVLYLIIYNGHVRSTSELQGVSLLTQRPASGLSPDLADWSAKL